MSKGVFCYRNLNRPGVVWSIKSNKTGKVISRSKNVLVKNAKLVVSEAGRKRVLKQKRKNVHAGVKGTWVKGNSGAVYFDNSGRWQLKDMSQLSSIELIKDGDIVVMYTIEKKDGSIFNFIRISYNPYNNKHFIRQDNFKPISEAELVILSKDGAWALNPKK